MSADIKYERIQHSEIDTVHTQIDDFDNDEIRIIENCSPDTKKRPLNIGIIQAATGTLGLILFYFALSIGLTFYQRWFLKDFPYPFSVVSYHLIIKFILAGLVRTVYTLVTGKNRVRLDCRTSFQKIAPCGIASGIDIGFSNWGLELVTISLYTMTKSTTIIFILIFAIILKLEKKNWSILVIVVMIASGLFLFTYKSTQFDALGFGFLLFASLSSGIRWSFAQLVMQKSKLGLQNPIDMVYYMQPWMLLASLPVAIGVEGKKAYDSIQSLTEIPTADIAYVYILISIGAVIAFAMELSEFMVLSYTSSLTLAVSGIFKEICQLILAVLINGDPITLMNILGLVVCLGGICCHVLHKYSLLALKSNEDLSECFDNDTNERHQQQQQQLNHQHDQQIQQKNHTNSSQNSNNNNNNNNNQQQSQPQQIKLKNRSGQTVPLLDSDDLDNSDSDDSQAAQQNASEVIFDILKRRDTRR